jgi:hypothetical protein
MQCSTSTSPWWVAVPQYISGRTSYLHVRLAFHPYPQLLPQFCNTGGCEPRRPVTGASLWPWIAHVVSGRIAATLYKRALHTRFPSGSLPLLEVNPCDTRCTRRIILQKARHQPYLTLRKEPERPLTAWEYVVSGSVSSPLRGAFHRSLTVLLHYRSLKVLSLGGWSPQLPTNSPGFVVLRMPTRPSQRLATGVSPPPLVRSSTFAWSVWS